MTTNPTNFEMQEMTFDLAWEYIKRMKHIFPLTQISKITGINRITLTTALNGTRNKYKKPSVLPERHHQSIIDFVKSTQFPSVMSDKVNSN